MRMNKINLAALCLSWSLFSFWLQNAQAVELEVNPSSTEISEDENLSVQFKATVEDYSGEIGNPEYSAPDFDEINSYNGMQGIESSFINGHVSVKKTSSVTVVLHPKKTGKLTISGIKIKINGKNVTAPDLTIDVSASGTQKNNNHYYNYGDQKKTLPNSGLHPNSERSSFFLKTEPSKIKAYKGEQIILSYALYTQVPILGISVERYPTVPGFLKEDIEIPLIRNQLQYQRSVVGGREYNRAVLAQYAVFPLKEGKLKIDALTGKFNYRTKSSRSAFDDDDPFGMLNQFMNSMQTASTSRSSDQVEVEVLPLPAEGQPKSFTGLVGDFEITAVVDKYTLKAGEALNVKVKVEGLGHAGSLEHLNVDWPKDFELYEDKSNLQYLRTGHSEKIFDFMMIPRAKGKFKIPAIELSMFNPGTKKYSIKKSQPIDIEVLEGSGDIGVIKSQNSTAATQPQSQPEVKKDVRYWINDVVDPNLNNSILKTIMRIAAILSIFIATAALLNLNKKELKPEEKKKSSKEYSNEIRTLKSFAEVERLLGDILEKRYSINKGSLTRDQLRAALEEQKVSELITNEIISILEHCESLRFIPNSANSSEVHAVVERLSKLISSIFR